MVYAKTILNIQRRKQLFIDIFSTRMVFHTPHVASIACKCGTHISDSICGQLWHLRYTTVNRSQTFFIPKVHQFPTHPTFLQLVTNSCNVCGAKSHCSQRNRHPKRPSQWDGCPLGRPATYTGQRNNVTCAEEQNDVRCFPMPLCNTKSLLAIKDVIPAVKDE